MQTSRWFQAGLQICKYSRNPKVSRKKCKTLGRPRVIGDREKVRQQHGRGNSVRIIAAQLGLTKSTCTAS
jgi:hypothetical protein